MLRTCARHNMSKSFEYLIVGGGNAAGYACRELAAQGVAGSKVGIVTAEAVPPYERPALTKAYLHPPSAKVRARLPGFHTCVGSGGERQTTEWYAEKGISFVNGKATAVDLASKSVRVGEDSCTYGKLLIATGARPLRVSQFGVQGDGLKNVFYVREEHEAAALVQALEALGGAGKAIIVGGGYIGLECAAALVGWGIEVTMVFPEARCMPRLFNDELGKWLEDEYTARGVKILKGDLVTEFVGEGGAVSGVKLKSGQTLPCSLAVVGVGASPNVEFCAGLAMEKGGFAVDPSMRTSDPSVFAIGDVCAFPSAFGGTARCEHVDHARRSAKQAILAATGQCPEPYKYLPYFYSRVFEYTDRPIVFNFFGDDSGECKVCSRGEKGIGAIWVKEGKVLGALLMGSPGPTADDQAKLREMVAAQPASADPAEVFAAAKL
uniref:monodehydroascorbate reductase (NADH) n=1 Tax=Alexandrium catenella TaxID=2925 RepID=A0A7S1LLM9_ALECA|mmetsp:Transcript_116270/g.309297  ORF Transcript_116270/g.309297 Transcript_116270/m.309297 type:complete len:436 (+) Transcript_116270:52-1359(+)